MPAPIADAAQPPGQAGFGDALTRHAVTIITAVIALLSFGFSFGNVTLLALSLGIPSRIAWLVSPPVDLSVIGLLLGLRSLSQHGYPAERLRKPVWMLRLCAAMTIALNTAGPAMRHEVGAALVDAILPVLLMAWGEVGPWLLRELYAVTQVAPRPEQEPGQQGDEESEKPRAQAPVLLPAGLVERARMLDAEHRKAHGRHISRDKLKAALAISTDRATALVSLIRAECDAAAAPGEVAGDGHQLLPRNSPAAAAA
jgi:hypothetical protein